jgi:adenylate cyclase
MEVDLDEALEEGRLRVAIAFADLAGYARLTVERGDEAAVSTVERFVEAVAQTLPADARVIKTLGDEVMIVGSDPVALAGWAVELASGTAPAEPQPRIGLHYGEALYRDGDYYGRDVNQAARVVARAGGGEVLVTRPVVDMAAGIDGVDFDRIGEVRLKGFSEPTELFTASRKT